MSKPPIDQPLSGLQGEYSTDYGVSSAVTSQVAPSAGVPGVPEGLEYLAQLDQVIIQQVLIIVDALTNWDCKNKFEVKNTLGQQVYFAAEESEVCMRQCCGQHRAFTMHIMDNHRREVIRARREFKCCAGCCWCAGGGCCAYEIAVEAPVGTVIGYVRQSCTKWKPWFEVMDANREIMLYVNGPCCPCECPCFDVEFTIFSTSGEDIGRVSKQWSGCFKECFSEADNYSITFPLDLDVKMKALLFSSVFLIDMMLFARKK